MEARKYWRICRIKLYNNLLLVANGAEGRAIKSWADTRELKQSESTYRYLLDQIHEDEEIMFKFYHAPQRSESDKRSLRKETFWLVESVRVYRERLVDPVVEALKEWDGKEEDKLSDAKQKFQDTVLGLGRSCKDRSWSNRALLYWLLGHAKHAPISKGKVGSFKSNAYNGPIHDLVQELIREDEGFLREIKRDDDSSHSQDVSIADCILLAKKKYDKQQIDRSVLLGTLKVCTLLDWASAVNDLDLVKYILKHKEEYLEGVESDWKSEESWCKSWANALWSAAYKGHAEVVKELLDCKFPADFSYHQQYCQHFKKKSIQPPLHVAVRRGHISVVEVFCTKSVAKKFSQIHKGDLQLDQTPLEAARNLEDAFTKRQIQSILLDVGEVKRAVEESHLQRDLTVSSANAIMVGAVLIAGVAYGGWLQPPLGYQTYYQFTEPLPAPPDTFSSYASVEGHTTVEVFALCNSLAFFFAVAAVVAVIETSCFMEAIEETNMAKTVTNLRSRLKWATGFFICSVICVSMAFASAAIAILPPIDYHRRRIYVTIGVGRLLCLLYIGRILLFCVSKPLYRWTISDDSRIRTITYRLFWGTLEWIRIAFYPNFCQLFQSETGN